MPNNRWVLGTTLVMLAIFFGLVSSLCNLCNPLVGPYVGVKYATISMLVAVGCSIVNGLLQRKLSEGGLTLVSAIMAAVVYDLLCTGRESAAMAIGLGLLLTFAALGYGLGWWTNRNAFVGS